MLKKIKNLIKIPLSIYHYKKGNLILPYLPNALWIEPTNICNLKCIMCPNSLLNKENTGYMDFGLYKKILDEAKDFVSCLVLCISGESLLNKDFPGMVRYAKNYGLATYLSTNCTVLTPQLSEEILQAGLDWINFSFDGCTKEVYEKIRIGSNFEKTLENIVNFLKIKKQLKARTKAELQILIMNEEDFIVCRENMQNFLKNFSGFPLDCIQIRRPSSWGGFFRHTDRFKPKKLSEQFSPCSYLWSSMHILWDGRIVACSSDFFGKNTLGRFPEKSLKAIWNDLPMQSFRKAMLNNGYLTSNENCRDCDSLWEKRILGLPAGIRGIAAMELNNLFDKSILGSFKRIAKFVNPDFAIDVVRKN